ncbi:MAG: chromosomal replication initiator protein DnaA [Treponema sp.]|nr:chromosomal replication initiator protein DnaA [Treponema sp.]
MAESDNEVLWNEILNLLRVELGEIEFSDWFVDIQYLRSSKDSITIGFPSAFHRDRVKKNYQYNIGAKLRELVGREITLNFEVPTKKRTEKVTTPKEPINLSSTEFSEETVAVNKNVPVAVEKIKREQHPDLGDDYTFERYIIGENNNFAANAAIAISRNPGTNYNPFFVYGGVGLGKTHLMQAIGNYIHEKSDKKVIYVTAEDFLNEFIECINGNKMKFFKNKFRRINVLLIDDIQILKGKSGVQDELFHTFEAVIKAKNQIVFTCDRPPSELKNFEARLISRFEQGLKVDLQPPRYEERFAILKAVAENRGTTIPDDVIDLISKKISSNVRDLIGALTKIVAYVELMGKQVTLEIAQHILKDVLVSSKQSNLSIEIIQKVVANHFSISVNDIKSKKKPKNIVYPRQLAMYICREMTEYSSTEIGQAFGGRDHTTVIYSVEKIRNRFVMDANLDSTIEILKRNVKELGTKM